MKKEYISRRKQKPTNFNKKKRGLKKQWMKKKREEGAKKELKSC